MLHTQAHAKTHTCTHTHKHTHKHTAVHCICKPKGGASEADADWTASWQVHGTGTKTQEAGDRNRQTSRVRKP